MKLAAMPSRLEGGDNGINSAVSKLAELTTLWRFDSFPYSCPVRRILIFGLMLFIKKGYEFHGLFCSMPPPISLFASLIGPLLKLFAQKRKNVRQYGDFC